MTSISPQVDIAFKKIFGVEENKDLLISLINSIVSPADQVIDVHLLNPYNPQNFRSDKLSILDIKARGFDGKMFNIEIQINDEADYDKRALYYWGKLYTEQLQAAEDFNKLSKAIGIHILNFLSIPESKKYHNVFHITEKEYGHIYFTDLELHTIELKKFSDIGGNNLQDFVHKITNSLDRWLVFLTRHDLLNANQLPANLDAPDLKKALGVLDVMNLNRQERDAYEAHLKWLRVEASALRKMREDSLAEGFAEGIVKGHAEGHAEGHAQGHAAGQLQASLAIARSLLQTGMSISQVRLVTGLSSEQIAEVENAYHLT